jgi:tetratricopeptide (TPR) repeat protein
VSTSERPLLAAALIVRDEADHLPACLASLAGLADEIHVHDTGSIDGSPELAESLGAQVTRGRWTDDFAAARNAGRPGWTAEWILSVDADDRAVADPARLRAELKRLLAGYDALRVDIDNNLDDVPYTHTEARLYRPGTVHWQGRVHERLVTASGGRPRTTDLARAMLVLEHHGFADPEARVTKALRNVGLARRALDDLAAAGFDADRPELARTLLALGRSHLGARQKQKAVDTFETVRELFPDTPEWLEATDFLARLVLSAGMDDVCLFLAGELRGAGASGPYCDWLAAQALAQLGDAPAAAELLSGLTEVVDTAGRRRDPRALDELRDLVNRLAGTATR